MSRAPSSRRAFLAGSTAIVAGTCATVAREVSPKRGAPTAERVDTAFRHWLAVQAEVDAASGYSDEWLDSMTQRQADLEREIRESGPSIMVAGALALFTLRWGIFFLSDTPNSFRADADTHDSSLACALAVLPHLVPSLTGSVATVAADFIAHPDREVRYSLLFRGQAAEA